MKYTVRVWTAATGDVVLLFHVAKAMARHAAMGYGTRPLHGPTLKNLLPERIALLRAAADKGLLTVCDWQGRIAGTQELIEAAHISDELNANDFLATLHVTKHHLIEWGKTCGDDFIFEETPGQTVNLSNSGLGSVGGGESEWFVEPDSAPKGHPEPESLASISIWDGLPKQQAQEEHILAILTHRGLDAKKLPARVKGKKGTKAGIRSLALGQPKLFTKSSFEKAWQRLRDDGRLGGD